MSNLTSEEIRQIGCNEWARYMDQYGYSRHNYLRNQPKQTIAARKMMKKLCGGNQNTSIKDKLQMQAE